MRKSQLQKHLKTHFLLLAWTQ